MKIYIISVNEEIETIRLAKTLKKAVNIVKELEQEENCNFINENAVLEEAKKRETELYDYLYITLDASDKTIAITYSFIE